MAKVKTTEKGTELPLMNLRGKDYLEVKYRLVWFRERFPEGSIQTEITEDGETATAKATVCIPINGNYVVLATAHKKETKQNFADNYEKSETGAIGRALAMAGFGTQFESEFDEGERIVDAPVETKNRSKPSAGSKSAAGNGPQKAQAPGTPNPQGAASNGTGNVVGTNPELRVVETGSEAIQDEAHAKKLIAAEADVIVNIKKVKTADELKQLLKDKYNVTTKNDLSFEQAKAFLGELKEISA